MIFLDLLSENDFRTVDSQPTSLSCETHSYFNTNEKNWQALTPNMEISLKIIKLQISEISMIINNRRRINNAGDIDVWSLKYIIECKESISKNVKTPDFMKQFNKYLNAKNPKYINIENKKVVLAIKKMGEGLEITHPLFKELQKQGVIIITDVKQIKNLK